MTCDSEVMSDPPTAVSRLAERQCVERDHLNGLLDSTPLVTVAFIRDGHPVALPIGAVRIGDQLVIHGSTGSPWLRELASGAQVSVCAAVLDGVIVARSGFESSFRYRSAVLFGTFTPVGEDARAGYLQALTDTFIPGRSAELRASTGRELAATLVLALPIGTDNWSVKISDGWPEDGDEDVEAGAWAGVVPIGTYYGEPVAAPDCDPTIPIPKSVKAMTGGVSNRRA